MAVQLLGSGPPTVLDAYLAARGFPAGGATVWIAVLLGLTLAGGAVEVTASALLADATYRGQALALTDALRGAAPFLVPAAALLLPGLALLVWAGGWAWPVGFLALAVGLYAAQAGAVAGVRNPAAALARLAAATAGRRLRVLLLTGVVLFFAIAPGTAIEGLWALAEAALAPSARWAALGDAAVPVVASLAWMAAFPLFYCLMTVELGEAPGVGSGRA